MMDNLNTLTIAWMALPFFLGFVVFLAPKLDRWLAMTSAIASAAFGLFVLFNRLNLSLELLDNFGVQLQVDDLSGYFILTNALVTGAVLLYCWGTGKSPFFYGQLTILHGSLNAGFICFDLISLYVAIEVISIAAFLLISYPRTDRTIWVGLRYLFVSNVSMLFYLVGAVLVYQANHTFSFAGLKDVPVEAFALIFLGLLAKGGIFVSGLWLPLTHSEAETPVSAMLSGIVVKAGVFPLVRLALLFESVNPIVRTFGVAAALLGVTYAMFEKDTKRMLAFHTISQLGFVLAAPVAGGFYALTHGLVKSSLFLLAGALPSRSFKDLQQKPIDPRIWLALVIASLSISGFPLLAGFAAKAWTTKELLSWEVIPMAIAAVGTAVSFGKFIFLPRGGSAQLRPGFVAAIALLIGGLVLGNIVYFQGYNLNEIIKSLVTIAAGWLLYWLVVRRVSVKLPRVFEEFDNLIGAMSLMLVLLFWVGVSWLGI
jgi:multicomponent Na+:H+ antiporter subunit D